MAPVDRRQQAVTAFKLDFTTTMPYPKGSYLQIQIDSSQVGPKDASAAKAVKCSSNLQLDVKCTFVNPNLVKVAGIFVDDLVKNSKISFMITNFQVKVTTPLNTKSWVVTVYTPAGHFIDRISSGLHLEFKCHSPCQTCAWDSQPANTKKCLTCNVLTGRTILY